MSGKAHAQQSGPNPTPSATEAGKPSSSGEPASTYTPPMSTAEKLVKDEPEEEDMEVLTTAAVLEKLLGAALMCSFTWGSSGLFNVDALARLELEPSAVAIGSVAAVPSLALIFITFLPTIITGYGKEQLKVIKAKAEEQDDNTLELGSLGSESDNTPTTPDMVWRGLWFFQMHMLKPWYPAFDWQAMRALYFASCVSAAAQEVFVRGFLGSLLVSGYNGMLAQATDTGSALFWLKVFRLATPDTSRWLAALTLVGVQLVLSLPRADAVGRFTRASMDALGPAARAWPARQHLGLSEPLAAAATAEAAAAAASASAGARPAAASASTSKLLQTASLPASLVNMSLSTKEVGPSVAEERVARTASLAVGGLLCLSSNFAWAASNSLLGSYTAQVVVDGLASWLQQSKALGLPERAMWEAVREEEALEDKERRRQQQQQADATGPAPPKVDQQ